MTHFIRKYHDTEGQTVYLYQLDHYMYEADFRAEGRLRTFEGSLEEVSHLLETAYGLQPAAEPEGLEAIEKLVEQAQELNMGYEPPPKQHGAIRPLPLLAILTGVAFVLFAAFLLGHSAGVESVARKCATLNAFSHEGHRFTCEDLDEDE